MRYETRNINMNKIYSTFEVQRILDNRHSEHYNPMLATHTHKRFMKGSNVEHKRLYSIFRKNMNYKNSGDYGLISPTF